MILLRHSASTPAGVRPLPDRLTRTGLGIGYAFMIAVIVASCGDDNGTGPDTLKFGLSGGITIQLETPLRLGSGTPRVGAGTLSQRLEWQSTGAWSLFEQISYRDLIGDETLWRSAGDPFIYVASYVGLINTVNSAAGLELFIPEMDTLASPRIVTCGEGRTHITFSIHDEPRDSTASWSLCADDPLTDLQTLNAGPAPAAARLVMATQFARDGTFGPDGISAYYGSVPFGTLARGEEIGSTPSAPFPILDDASFQAFWLEHAGSTNPPEVDFGSEMVIVGAVGPRGEAGDSVEVRRILQIDNGTLTHLVERVPGDFCSPVARTHYPFHIVVAPMTPTPIQFANVGLEFVSCGG